MVVNTQWLADAMARVVSHRSRKRVPGGILDHGQDNLNALWPEAFEDPVTTETRALVPAGSHAKKVRETLLRTMHRFGLALKLKHKNGLRQNKSIVPAMLGSFKDPTRHDVDWKEVSATHQVLGLLTTLDFVPHNLVSQFLKGAYQYAPPGDNTVGW